MVVDGCVGIEEEELGADDETLANKLKTVDGGGLKCFKIVLWEILNIYWIFLC